MLTSIADTLALVVNSPSSIFSKEDVVKLLNNIEVKEPEYDTNDMAQKIVNLIEGDARSFELSLSGSEINVEINESFVRDLIQEFLDDKLQPEEPVDLPF